MTILFILLLSNSALHALIVGRFGIKGNVPPAVFGILYAGLATASFLDWTHVSLAALGVTTIGLVGLALNFKKLQHETTVEKIIFMVGIAIIAYAALTQFAA